MLTEPQSILDALPEPTLMVRLNGDVVLANKAARAVLGKADASRLSSVSDGDPGELGQYLRRCSGSGQPVIGKLCIEDAAGRRVPFRCAGNRVRARSDSGPPLILLRLSSASDERFIGLKRQIEALHAENRHRRRIQALLEEAVKDRDLLIREIRHRIGNNFQMLLGMLSSARTRSKQPEARSIMDRACSRIVAINAAQRLLYGKRLESVCTTDFIWEVSQATLEATDSSHALAVDVDRTTVSNDLVTPVALIISELITNAVKHGFPDKTPGKIKVGLRLGGDELELTVSDNGVGFDGSQVESAGSGFEIVRGLVRQLGGRFDVRCDGGTHCIVRFQDRNATDTPALGGGVTTPA